MGHCGKNLLVDSWIQVRNALLVASLVTFTIPSNALEESELCNYGFEVGRWLPVSKCGTIREALAQNLLTVQTEHRCRLTAFEIIICCPFHVETSIRTATISPTDINYENNANFVRLFSKNTGLSSTSNREGQFGDSTDSRRTPDGGFSWRAEQNKPFATANQRRVLYGGEQCDGHTGWEGFSRPVQQITYGPPIEESALNSNRVGQFGGRKTSGSEPDGGFYWPVKQENHSSTPLQKYSLNSKRVGQFGGRATTGSEPDGGFSWPVKQENHSSTPLEEYSLNSKRVGQFGGRKTSGSDPDRGFSWPVKQENHSSTPLQEYSLNSKRVGQFGGRATTGSEPDGGFYWPVKQENHSSIPLQEYSLNSKRVGQFGGRTTSGSEPDGRFSWPLKQNKYLASPIQGQVSNRLGHFGGSSGPGSEPVQQNKHSVIASPRKSSNRIGQFAGSTASDRKPGFFNSADQTKYFDKPILVANRVGQIGGSFDMGRKAVVDFSGSVGKNQQSAIPIEEHDLNQNRVGHVGSSFVSEEFKRKYLLEGDPCHYGEKKGKCLPFSKCVTLHEAFAKNLLGVQTVLHCGLSVFEEIICCPLLEERPIRTTTIAPQRITTDANSESTVDPQKLLAQNLLAIFGEQPGEVEIFTERPQEEHSEEIPWPDKQNKPLARPDQGHALKSNRVGQFKPEHHQEEKKKSVKSGLGMRPNEKDQSSNAERQKSLIDAHKKASDEKMFKLTSQ